MQIDVLGSTGNVYHTQLQAKGNACSCLDFAKGGGVCKHLLFVALRVLKLGRDDHRVWQTSLVPSELEPLLARLDQDPGAGAGGGVAADALVLRGYRQACGEGAAGARRGCRWGMRGRGGVLWDLRPERPRGLPQ